MPKPLLPITAAGLVASPFFVLEGPDGSRLTCQWTAAEGRQIRGENEFEIVCPETPDLMGRLFGIYDASADEFRMRPDTAPAGCRAAEVDLGWRGDLNSVMDTGSDWEWDRDEDRLVLVDLPLAA